MYIVYKCTKQRVQPCSVLMLQTRSSPSSLKPQVKICLRSQSIQQRDKDLVYFPHNSFFFRYIIPNHISEITICNFEMSLQSTEKNRTIGMENMLYYTVQYSQKQLSMFWAQDPYLKDYLMIAICQKNTLYMENFPAEHKMASATVTVHMVKIQNYKHVFL